MAKTNKKKNTKSRTALKSAKTSAAAEDRSSSSSSVTAAAAAKSQHLPRHHGDDGGGDKSDSRDEGRGCWSSLPWSSAAPLSSMASGAAAGKKKRKRRRPDEFGHNDEDNDNNNDDDDAADDDDDASYSSVSSSDLYDPNPRATSNRYDVDAHVEGAHDPGMLLGGLEVISGDSYRVERIKTKDGGTVTRVVAADDNDDGALKKTATKGKKEKGKELKTNKRKKAASDDDDINNDDRTEKETKEVEEEAVAAAETEKDSATATNLTKKELKILKRKARKKERKLLKKKQRKMEQAAAAATAPGNEASSSAEQPQEGGEDRKDAAATAAERQRLHEQHQLSIDRLRTSWSIAAPGLWLHPTLCRGLDKLQYHAPTPIQSATLPASMLGRRDVVGAAPTGSGKTLSYGLPILQWILENRGDGVDDGEIHKKPNRTTNGDRTLVALILCPTRELALQVSGELQRVSCDVVWCSVVVGGLAAEKQRRVLETKRPPIVVGTPGRLWELMSSNEHTHLRNLSQLRFLVIDEADRMIRQGSFPQLKQIFSMINKANPPPPHLGDEDLDGGSDDDDDDRLRSLRGVRGEAKVTMLDDSILERIEQQRSGGGAGENDRDKPQPVEMDDDEYLTEQQRLVKEEEDSAAGSDDDEPEPVHRQTFVYSATLTLPPSAHYTIKSKAVALESRKRRGKKKTTTTVEGAIAEILEMAGARGQTKVVDLSSVEEGQDVAASGSNSTQSSEASGVRNKKAKASVGSPARTRLPPGLSLHQIRSTQRHKDSHLYAYLATTRQGSSGPCLVFCNSIAAVRRVGEMLRLLGLPVRTLHAQMAQKARLSALESLRIPKSRSILVATDVAARGLDIPSVSTVIHYDAARAVDTFIHRAGRTARGVGESAVGASVSLVAPSEDKLHQKICEAVQGSSTKGLHEVSIDGRLLSSAQERTALATKIFECEEVESKASKKNKWFVDAAADAGFDLDEDLLDGGLTGGDNKDRLRLLEAKRAKAALRELLSRPMRKQNFGKFLSNVGLSDAIKSEAEVTPYIVRQNKNAKGKASIKPRKKSRKA